MIGAAQISAVRQLLECFQMSGIPLERIGSIVKEILELIEAGKFEEIKRLDRGNRLSAADLQNAIEGYGATMIAYMDHDRSELNIIEVVPAEVPTWFVDVPLYGQEEGRTDLTLSLVVFEEEDGGLGVEIDDCHVL